MEYIRDKRSPTPSSKNASKVMSSIRAKDTKPEKILRSILWRKGLRGYRLHPKSVPGRPDICYTSKKIAIFVNGCYWHRCPHCNLKLPRSNTKFWQEKFERNKERDNRTERKLEKDGWICITVWECQLEEDPVKIIEEIMSALQGRNLNRQSL